MDRYVYPTVRSKDFQGGLQSIKPFLKCTELASLNRLADGKGIGALPFCSAIPRPLEASRAGQSVPFWRGGGTTSSLADAKGKRLPRAQRHNTLGALSHSLTGEAEVASFCSSRESCSSIKNNNTGL